MYLVLVGGGLLFVCLCRGGFNGVGMNRFNNDSWNLLLVSLSFS